MQRRKFIQSSCNLCLLTAVGYLLPTLTSCSAVTAKALQTDVINNTITIPINQINPSGLQIIHPRKSLYDIALQKQPDGSYEALLLQCTHQENQLTPTGNGYACSLHGSQFDKNGNVTHGPASESLQRYKTNIQNNQLFIYINA